MSPHAPWIEVLSGDDFMISFRRATREQGAAVRVAVAGEPWRAFDVGGDREVGEFFMRLSRATGHAFTVFFSGGGSVSESGGPRDEP